MATNPWAAAARMTPNELRDVPIFASLADGDLRWLAARGTETTLDSGSVLFREGDPADAIVWDELAGRAREEGLNVTLLTSRQYYPHAGCIGIGRL